MGESVTMDELGGPRVHSRNGVCDLVADDDHAAAELVRDLLGHLPQSSAEPPDPVAPPGSARRGPRRGGSRQSPARSTTSAP